MIQYYVQMNYLNVAQLGRALRSGRRGRGFKSRHSDHCDEIRSNPDFFIT